LSQRGEWRRGERAHILLWTKPFFTQELGFGFFNTEAEGVRDSYKSKSKQIQ
jgi:hypothetical protein